MYVKNIGLLEILKLRMSNKFNRGVKLLFVRVGVYQAGQKKYRDIFIVNFHRLVSAFF